MVARSNLVSRGSIAFRLVVGAALWIAAALIAGGLLLSALFRDYVERNFDSRMSVFLDALVAASEIDGAGQIALANPPGEPRFDQPYSGWYWQVSDAGGLRQASRSLWDQTLALVEGAPTGAIQSFAATGPNGQRLRVLQRDVILPESGGPLHYAVAADSAELDAELAPFNQTLVWSLAVLGLGLIGAVLIQVPFGLRPLWRLRAALAEIRAGRAERLDGDYPTELKPLANELNALISHNAQVLERARTHVGNLAHALKTPLAVLNNEAARDTGSLGQTVARQVAVMRRWVDHYLARARAAATVDLIGARTEIAGVVADLSRTLMRIHAERQVMVEAAVAPELAFRGDRQDLEEMLGNLMDNGCKWARRRVRVEGRSQTRDLVLTIDDDGRGLDPAERAEALGRGRRLDESVTGSGLGLAIVRDIAELYGGRLELDASPLGGLRAILVLPDAG